MVREPPDQIVEKANRVLYLLLFFFLAIGFRVWHLTLFLHEERLEEAKKPMVRTLFEPGKRGTIRDRFGIPLALNRLSYGVGVTWGEIAEVPGKRFRKEYITALSELLGKELEMEPRRVEDLIYSKAVFFGNAPCMLKEGISEESFYRLNALAKDWPGISLERGSKRFYPQGKVGCDVLGYMGAIDRPFMEKIFSEIVGLKTILEEEYRGEQPALPEGFTSFQEIEDRINFLEEKAYTIHDAVGIQGVEKSFEKELRGYRGKRSFEVDAKGHFLKELGGGQPPRGGERLSLSISQELQLYAEEVLAAVEKIHAASPLHAKRGEKPIVDARGPWIRGGAIIAIEPETGEVLALASHPRFDPNAFVPYGGVYKEKERLQEVRAALESDRFLMDVWMEERPLEREFFDLKKGVLETEKIILGWEEYLKAIFVRDELSLKALYEIDTIEKGVALRRSNWPLPSSLTPDEKLQVIDLVGLLIDESRFNDELLKHVGKESLSTLKKDQGLLHLLKRELKEEAKTFFHLHYFLPWREKEGKVFLKRKRNEEREGGTWARPYLDHFDREEKRQFETFWKEWGEQIVFQALSVDHLLPFSFESSTNSPLKERIKSLPTEAHEAYLKALRDWDEMKRPLQAAWQYLSNRKRGEQALALSFHPRYGWGTGRSFAFRQASTQGSLFKLVIAWGALNHRYHLLEENGEKITREKLNPLTIFDEVKRTKGGWTVGRFEGGGTIPQLYKGGRLPRSMNYQLGKLDIEKAIETSSNPYFSLLAGEILSSPQDVLQMAESLSYGQKTGLALPGEYRGKLPVDLDKNRTGLYATAIGQHTLVVTPIQTAIMLNAIANGGKIIEPKIVLEKPCEIRREVHFPLPVQEVILKGMRGVISHLSKEEVARLFPKEKSFKEIFERISPYLIGKTSTSDAIERLGPLSGDAYQVCHVWFGGICFEGEPFPAKGWNDSPRKPELVVVVHLRYSRLGKEALPIATLIIDKWREIKQKHKS
jgi:cell division protein FtsI/penicillin-binding protein 2